MKLWYPRNNRNHPPSAFISESGNLSSQLEAARSAGRRLAAGSNRSPKQMAYLLTEALVYIGLVFVLLGVAYAGLYRFIDNSVLLRRSCEDISRAMHAGERWRADIRSASAGVRLESNPEGDILHLQNSLGEIAYTIRHGAVLRRAGTGPWVSVLANVKASSMQDHLQPGVKAWRWELELLPQTKGSIKPGRVRPLFTFLAAPRPLAGS